MSKSGFLLMVTLVPGALAQRSITLGATYTIETFTDGKGNVQTLGSFVPTLDIDLKKLGRGHVFVSGQFLHGHGINDARIGALQPLSNLDAAGFSKLVEAWYADSLFDGKLRFKAGRQYADADFGLVQNGGTFLSSSYGVMPTTPMPTYPKPELGASVWVTPARKLSFGAGVFRGAFTIAEAKVEPQRGTYRAGVWSQGSHHGVYAAADHWLTHSEDHRGPGVFAQWGWRPSERNEVCGYAGGGFVYQGIRAADTAGVGFTRVVLSSSQNETIYEMFYRVQVNRHVALQPDVQWVRNPGGSGAHGLATGIRLALTL